MEDQRRNTKPRVWSEAEKLQLAELIRDGESALAISTELERYVSSIKRMAKKMGLVLKK